MKNYIKQFIKRPTVKHTPASLINVEMLVQSHLMHQITDVKKEFNLKRCFKN